MHSLSCETEEHPQDHLGQTDQRDDRCRHGDAATAVRFRARSARSAQRRRTQRDDETTSKQKKSFSAHRICAGRLPGRERVEGIPYGIRQVGQMIVHADPRTAARMSSPPTITNGSQTYNFSSQSRNSQSPTNAMTAPMTKSRRVRDM